MILQLGMFSQNVYHRRITFTACGLFVLDAELLLPVSSTPILKVSYYLRFYVAGVWCFPNIYIYFTSVERKSTSTLLNYSITDTI